MRCTSPRTVGFLSDGKTLCWSRHKYSKEFSTFAIPCGKCISCRLESARQTAVRCVHEASLHKKNVFITLTYDEAHVGDGRLHYRDFQLFMKRLREEIRCSSVSEDREKNRISVFCAGEYGEKRKRPHWHALIFNWSPDDLVKKYTSDRGDQVYSSEILTRIWGKGICEIGSVTFESAGYCARYASKKLVHGKDGEHEFNPISRRSVASGIGRRWIEKNWRDVFTHGYLIFKNKEKYIQCGIPRYYEKWLKMYQPLGWKRYVTEVKPKIVNGAEKKSQETLKKEFEENIERANRMGLSFSLGKTQRESEAEILAQKFDKLQKNLKDL